MNSDIAPSQCNADVTAGAPTEEMAPCLRHDLRNKFAAIRNAVFYIERSLTRSQTIDHDPRVARFLQLVCEQLDAADALLEERGRHAALVSIGDGSEGPDTKGP